MRSTGLEKLLLLHDGMKAACDAGTLAENVRPYIARLKAALRQCMDDSTADAADWCESPCRVWRPKTIRWTAHIDQMLASLADEHDDE